MRASTSTSVSLAKPICHTRVPPSLSMSASVRVVLPARGAAARRAPTSVIFAWLTVLSRSSRVVLVTLLPLRDTCFCVPSANVTSQRLRSLSSS